jgi:hypothetical protein
MRAGEGATHSAELLRGLGGEAAVETLFKVGFASFLLGNGAEQIVLVVVKRAPLRRQAAP